ncbi:alpha-amylase [Pyrococcus furiosus DSM 3638]|uniref:Cyclomaltodextrin glucanotransferase n=4 Tax=Pyrococcus furiosus TaxID=2261 RepID=Q3HUR2_PYRFU|nr:MULTISPECIES: alpha-amylase family glycosyl hydrolase [Pyrococcus]ABA33720.1 cyclomaltodextrin glucanotransferase [Pyrococcus furiosus DSM 3638]AFN03272.1 alpha-amylase [Pyrococcus furiosus COM1]MDK2869353.1 cyclomaltodextrin glucanotransferase [Pyrococcus sp.]QEK78191.1 alpha-amylase [Pyrococcus furiosus DSM 3638]
MRKLIISFTILVLYFSQVAAYYVPERSVIYQIMVDRFYDRNPTNNEPFYDPEKKNYRLYWGGDIEGIIERLDYIESLGVSMIWLSPLNDNINRMAGGSAPYHGYWPRDFKRIDEHFGTWEDFRRLVEEAKKRGICIIVDYVPNHSNPATDGEFGALYDNGTLVTNYYEDRKNATRNPYTASLENIYHHNGNINDWFGFQLKYANLFGLADFNQMNDFVDNYLKEGAALFVKNGACGFRIDAVKHIELGWLETFYLYLYQISDEPLFIYGEYFANTPDKTFDLYEFYRYSNVSSLLNIPIRESIARTFAYGGSFEQLAKMLEEYYSLFVYPNKQLNFLDSHDLVRFLNMNPNKDRYHMALGLVMTLPGIPVIYYGDESYLVSKEGKGDPYNRPMMVFDNSTKAAEIIRKLSLLRKVNDALAYSDFRTVYVDYNTWIFERKFGSHKILVALNKGPDKNITISLNWTDGTYIDIIEGAILKVKEGQGEIKLPRYSFYVFHVEEEQKTPLIGSITPYIAQPGQKILIAGAGLNGNIKVYIGGRRARIIEKEENSILVEVPEIKTMNAWIPVWVVVNGTRSNEVKLRYYSSNDIPALIVLQGNYTGYLWVKGNIPELSEPRPLLKSPTGHYFAVVPLPRNKTFTVQLYKGLPWEPLQPTNVTLYGIGNKTVILNEAAPETPVCGPGIVAVFALLPLLKRKKKKSPNTTITPYGVPIVAVSWIVRWCL